MVDVDVGEVVNDDDDVVVSGRVEDDIDEDDDEERDEVEDIESVEEPPSPPMVMPMGPRPSERPLLPLSVLLMVEDEEESGDD